MIKHLLGVSALVLGACASSAVVTPVAPLAPVAEMTRASFLAIGAICGADVNAGRVFTADLKLAEGMGTGGFKVDSDSAEAQAWFNYGMSLSHAFYHEDVKAAMKRSVAADPDCAACSWGEAWALGPTLNYQIDDEQRIAALAAAERAQGLVKPGDERMARMTEAMVARYQPSETSTEMTFGLAMKAIGEAYPDEVEVTVLAAHSMMMPVRWDDESGLKPALAMLEGVLAKEPENTGAIHYYIHGTEFDGRAEDALPYADRLGALAPAASHLVHMPAHTYFRAGQYYTAALVNANAIEADADWQRTGGDFSGVMPRYYAHNLAFGLAGALMAGDAQLAVKYAEHADTIWPAQATGVHELARSYALPRTWVALARYAPERALALPVEGEGPSYALYRAYARGEALLQMGDVGAAKREMRALGRIKDADDEERFLAQHVLQGRIAMAEGRTKTAMKAFEAAAVLQEQDLAESWDPPAWWYPVRRSLAAAHLKAGEFAAAETEANAVLASWKHDPLALWVLAQAESGLGKSAQAVAHSSEAREIWRGDYSSITADAI